MIIREIIVIYCTVLVLFLVQNVEMKKGTTSRRCYICGIGADEPFWSSQLSSNQLDKLKRLANTPCKDLELNIKNMTEFAVECPAGYVGCLTQTEGEDSIRTCDTVSINDCQTANGVRYCYCNKDLCNGITRIRPSKVIESKGLSKSLHTDDEDLSESSGAFKLTRDEDTGRIFIHPKNEIKFNEKQIPIVLDDQFKEITTNVIVSSTTTNSYSNYVAPMTISFGVILFNLTLLWLTNHMIP